MSFEAQQEMWDAAIETVADRLHESQTDRLLHDVQNFDVALSLSETLTSDYRELD